MLPLNRAWDVFSFANVRWGAFLRVSNVLVGDEVLRLGNTVNGRYLADRLAELSFVGCRHTLLCLCFGGKMR